MSNKGDLPLLIIMQDNKLKTISNMDDEDLNSVFQEFMNIDFDFMVFDNTYKVSTQNMMIYLTLDFERMI